MKSFLKGLIFILLLLSVVAPNSLQEVTAAFLIAAAIVSAIFSNPLRQVPCIAYMYFASSAVSLIYLLIGKINGAPDEAVLQIVFIYMVSPALWLMVATALFDQVDEGLIARWFVFFAIASGLSVLIFFYLFQRDGPDAVQFFIQDANLNLADGYAGATMFVYGSLIFIAAGFFAAPSIVRRPFLRAAMLVALPVVAVTSGRSALILSVPLGLVIGWIFGRNVVDRERRPARRLLSGVGLLLAVGAGFLLLATYSTVDLGLIVSMFAREIQEGGGAERTLQAKALLEGVVQTFAVGAGHGIGVDFLRSEKFPWRYEMVSLATVYRVGLIGSLVYALPFVICVLTFFELKKRKVATAFDVFLFSGFVSALIAANTNPYIEAFSFQWMFVLPLVAFEIKRRRLGMESQARNSLVTISS